MRSRASPCGEVGVSAARLDNRSFVFWFLINYPGVPTLLPRTFSQDGKSFLCVSLSTQVTLPYECYADSRCCLPS